MNSSNRSTEFSKRKMLSATLAVECGAVSIPHPLKVYKGGEDAYFITDSRTHSHFAFGVADGVGGWADSGVDPAIFAKSLMLYCKGYLEDPSQTQIVSTHTPVHALRYALNRVFEDMTRGSSTALVGVLEEDRLHIANVGDSGIIVFRPNVQIEGSKSTEFLFNIVYRSADQLHGFNFPFQLGMTSSDTPENAICTTITLLPGDILVVASDGLFDNLFDEEVLEAICVHCCKSAEEIAQLLGNWAFRRSTSTSQMSPFTKKAMEIGSYHHGGKSDDITILVFKIPQEEEGSSCRL